MQRLLKETRSCRNRKHTRKPSKNGKRQNRALKDNDGRTYDIIFGDFLVISLTEENFGSLSDELIEKYTKFFYF